MTSLWKKYCALVGLVIVAILGCDFHFSRPATQPRVREPVPLVRMSSLETSKYGIKESRIESAMTDIGEALQRDGESDAGGATAAAEAGREAGVGETPRIQEKGGEQGSVASQRKESRRGAGASAVRGRAKNAGARVESGSNAAEGVASGAAADEEGGGSGAREAGEGGREAASQDSTGEAKQGGRKLPGASQSTQLRERYRKSEAVGMRCGGMPAAMRPAFVAQKTRSGRRKALMPAHSGSVTAYDAQGGRHRVRTEHGPRATVQEQPGQARGPGEKALAACLRNLNDCSEAAREASWALNGVRKAWLGTEKLLSKPYGSCAVVGNSGALNRAAYGSFIDAHDYVMRINALPLQGRGRNLGTKTSGRVLSNKISQMVCCHSKRYKPDNPAMEFHLWFPGTRETTAKRIRERFQVQAAGMPAPFLKSAVSAFKALRQDLLGLGYGPFEDWEFMTGGMHAVLGLLRSCESLSLFGFTTDDTSGAAYWFTGQRHAPASGRRQHAWDHERMALRLLYAAGALDICTS